MATLQTCQTVGMPGCRVPLAELVTYLAEAPKSTRAYEGYNRAERLVKRDPTLLVPIAMRDMPVGMMEAIGDGEVYKYQPEYRCALFSSAQHEMKSQNFIVVKASGDERVSAVKHARRNNTTKGRGFVGQVVG